MTNGCALVVITEIEVIAAYQLIIGPHGLGWEVVESLCFFNGVVPAICHEFQPCILIVQMYLNIFIFFLYLNHLDTLIENDA